MGGRERTSEEDRVLEELLVVGAVRAVEELGEGRLNAHRERSCAEQIANQIESSEAYTSKVDLATRRVVNFFQLHFFRGLQR